LSIESNSILIKLLCQDIISNYFRPISSIHMVQIVYTYALHQFIAVRVKIGVIASFIIQALKSLYIKRNSIKKLYT